MPELPNLRPLLGGVIGIVVTVAALISMSGGPWAALAAAPLLLASIVHLVLFWHQSNTPSDASTAPVLTAQNPSGSSRVARHGRRAALYAGLAGAIAVAFHLAGTGTPAPDRRTQQAQNDEQMAHSLVRGWQAGGGPRNANGEPAESGDVLHMGANMVVTLISVTPDTVAFAVHQGADAAGQRVWCYEPARSNLGETAALTSCGTLL